MKVVIVGGVAGGMSAATRLRRLAEHAEIVVLERGGYVSFANCGLPYHVGGVIPERDDLLLQSPEGLRERFGLDVRVRHEALGIDRTERRVRVRDLTTGNEYTEDYDTLILSPGAGPVVPPVPGAERALTLRDIDDLDRLTSALRGNRDGATAMTADGAGKAVVVGAGFIGVEVAENLRHRGIEVTMIELADQVLAPLDPEMAAPVADRLRAGGVRLRLGVQINAIDDDGVELSDGDRVPAGTVVMAIGVRPETALARAAGLEIGERGGIVVDEHMRTSDADIFAVGDAVEKRDAVGGTPALIALANLANRQGRIAADAICGLKNTVRPAVGTAVVSVFGLTVAATGWNEKRLRAVGRPYRVIHTHGSSHAGYYPGARPLALKLLVDPDTDAVLGAQVVGEDGAERRIDVLATAMAGGLAASELIQLELAYAPQYGSAKDPVNMLGYVADNLRAGTSRTVQWHELAALAADGARPVDVRSEREFAAGAIPGAINIPLDRLRDRIDQLPDGDLVVYCKGGQRAYNALRILTQHGRTAVNLDGGYLTWSAGTGAASAT
ncbi:FAD-dependent oxidoreductase [Actinomadura formosensis]|uniref:FAD-dependent oxidoreductase n=1 Tax=Actinomadura formosensis TaxID=60706 RepID=UPI0008344EDE|nr:FAD-dependent oxidoreductase [Actinomadura formosensis]